MPLPIGGSTPQEGSEAAALNGMNSRDNNVGQHSSSTPQLMSALAENRELRAEIEQLRGERARMLDRQNQAMELLGTKNPERLIHDLRNLLNERALLRALSEMD